MFTPMDVNNYINDTMYRITKQVYLYELNDYWQQLLTKYLSNHSLYYSMPLDFAMSQFHV